MLARLNQLRIALALPFFSRTKVDPTSFRSIMSTSEFSSRQVTLYLTKQHHYLRDSYRPAGGSDICIWLFLGSGTHLPQAVPAFPE